ncbi:hypothetical protein, partial [Planococcus plakortidis]|uniref:hypothetical protein n=1 Tax=Planococcus plakortidis TaxID=1038856 RepID=UPI00385C6AC1
MKTEQQNVNERRHKRLGARTAFAMVALGRSEQAAIPSFGVCDLTTDQRMQIKANRASFETAMRQQLLSNQYYSIMESLILAQDER